MADSKISPEHQAALRKRGLCHELAERMGVKTIPGTGIAIDYLVNGQLHNSKIRAPGKRMWFEQKDKALHLWNQDSLIAPPQPGEAVIITEGELDGIAAIQAGFSRVVSVPNGAPGSADEAGERYKYLYRGKHLIPDLAKFLEHGRIILAVDGDQPGRHLRDALAVRIGDERCYWVDWPKGCKDANDVLKPENGGTQEERNRALRRIILNAKPMWNDEVSTLDDIPEPASTDIHDVMIAELTGRIRFQLPEFMVLLGPYHCGKSVFLRQLLWSLWKTYGWKFLLTALEERVKPRIRDHFRCLDAGHVPVDEEAAYFSDCRINQAALFLHRPPYPNLLTPEHFFDRVELAVRRDGVKVVALDPVNELEHNVGRNETQYWAKFISTCKQIADQYKLLFIVTGHPSKDVYNRAQGRVITLSDMSGSAHWGNKADRGIMLWRPDRTGPTILFQEKTKDHVVMGKPFMAELNLDEQKKLFTVGRIGWNIIEPQEQKKQKDWYK